LAVSRDDGDLSSDVFLNAAQPAAHPCNFPLRAAYFAAMLTSLHMLKVLISLLRTNVCVTYCYIVLH